VNTKYLIYYLLLVVLGFISCDTFNPKEAVPAFINIDTAFVEVNVNLQGSSAHQIKNVWVFNNVEPLGTFPLPAKIPILDEGNSNIILQPGIKLNNRSDNLAVYEVMTSDTFAVNLKSGEIINYQPTFSYKQSAYFDLIYDFELANNFSNTRGNAQVQATSNKNLVFEGNRSLTIVLDELNTSFKIVSADVLDVQRSLTFVADEIPADGRNTYIEMHYKNDATITVGLITNSSGLPNFSTEILIIGAKKEWSKIYIPLTNFITSNSVRNIRLYFEGALADGQNSARFSWDNIKIIHEL